MSGAMDNAGTVGAVQTWPLVSVASVTAAPLPKASPHPSPLPQAGEGAVSPAPGPARHAAVDAASLPPPLAGEGRGEGKPEADQIRFTEQPPEPGSMTVTAQTSQPASLAQSPGSAGMVGSTVLALLLVVGVILALAWLVKRMPGFGAVGGGNPSLKIVGSLALGPRERVVVVEVGGTQLLLSTGPHGTRTLHTLEQPLPAPANTPSPFAQVLARQFGKKSS